MYVCVCTVHDGLYFAERFDLLPLFPLFPLLLVFLDSPLRAVDLRDLLAPRDDFLELPPPPLRFVLPPGVLRPPLPFFDRRFFFDFLPESSYVLRQSPALADCKCNDSDTANMARRCTPHSHQHPHA
jgi:hypothetical protein